MSVTGLAYGLSGTQVAARLLTIRPRSRPATYWPAWMNLPTAFPARKQLPQLGAAQGLGVFQDKP